MKAHEIKYVFLLDRLRERPEATQAQLAGALDMPASLVNRYLKRLVSWGAVMQGNGNRNRRALSEKGRALLERASWKFMDFASGLIGGAKDRAVALLRREAKRNRWRKAALYGATAMFPLLRAWAEDAGLTVAGVCDEERSGPGIVGLDDLESLRVDVLILSDWARAEDRLLLALLSRYAPVVNLFSVRGAAKPEWR